MPNKRGEVRWLGGRSRGSRDSESKTRRTVMKDSPLLKWELAPVLLPPCRRSGCSGSGSPRSTGPAAPAALVPRKRPRRPRPPLASVVAILPAPPPAKATIVAIVPRCTPPKERAPPRPAFQVCLFLLSLLTAPQQKKKEIATFVCVFYSDLPSRSPLENRDLWVGSKISWCFFMKKGSGCSGSGNWVV